MTLIEQVQRLRVAAVAAHDEDKINRRTGELAGQAENVETLIETIQRLSRGVAELRTAHAALDNLDPQAAQLAADLHALAEMLHSQDADAPLQALKAQVKAADGFVKGLRKSVEQAWIAERNREVPVINEDLVTTLSKSGIDVEEIRIKIEKAQGVLNVLNNRVVPESGDVARLTAALESLQACGKQISVLVDPILARVIMGAQEAAGTPLNSFTPEVLTGLSRLGILDRFWVRLR
ncbi:hypothetical protein KVH02_20845 [Streptomyces olivaceus]|uniref:Uncharacterized protein n=1 Tax=Streptomyces olivaceus TaxID=47716 RepID=A0ABS7W6Y9_STROV|nr:hypothetical protein [Streptomyces olivaceus]MBZ6090752.1 hypothetical protein [Streptomyces olivaceus]MBZ6096927.1 hypothetical protein [Streptomyces olivaceus]MBZ6119536.1 hypothetical protein [Streptomyces olivaceus]MBZ6153252.1 hypothetical protein [Streptomyces olivaceus]MBZ6299335.1 hypothetical protein [Streptomyces olivaceus]